MPYMNEHVSTEKSVFKRFEKVMFSHFHKKSDDAPHLLSWYTIRNDMSQIINALKVFIYLIHKQESYQE